MKETNNRYAPITVEEIPWDALNKAGITANDFQPGELEALLRGEKSKVLKGHVTIGTNEGSKIYLENEMRVQLYRKQDGIGIASYNARRYPNYYYVQNTALKPDERMELQMTGRISHPVSIKFGEKETPCVVTLDSATNQTMTRPVNSIFVPNPYLGVQLSDAEVQLLRSGGITEAKEFQHEGKTFSLSLAYDPIKEAIQFFNPAVAQRLEQSMHPDLSDVEMKPEESLEITLSDAEINALKRGEYVEADVVRKGQTTPEPGYLYYNIATGLVHASRLVPHDASKITTRAKLSVEVTEEQSQKQEQKQKKTNKRGLKL